MKYDDRIPEEVDRALTALGPAGSDEQYTRELQRQRFQKRARAELAAEDNLEAVKGWEDPPSLTAREFLEIPDLEADYRVEGLWPIGGSVVLVAQAKAGKTTLMLNLIKSLVTGNDFMRRFPVQEVTGRVCLIDLELSDHTLRRWLRDLSLGSEKLLLMPMRGQGAWLSEAVTNPVARSRFADWLRESEVDVLIIDPLAPLLAGARIDENSNTEVGQLLRVGLAALQAESGVSELLLVHHAGHDGNRARGASVLMDWPDAIWTYELKAGSSGRGGQGAGDVKDATRYFQAVGRDVDLAKTPVDYDPDTRRLTIDADPTLRGVRRQATEDAEKDAAVLAVLKDRLQGRAETDAQWKKAVGGHDKAYRASRDRLVKSGAVRQEEGGRNGAHKFLAVEAVVAPNDVPRPPRPQLVAPVGDEVPDTSSPRPVP